MVRFNISNPLPTCDCIIIPVFEEEKLDANASEFDAHSQSLLSKLIESKDFEGKKMQTALLYSNHKNIPRILLLGFGKRQEISPKRFKEILGSGIVTLQDKKMTNLGILFSDSIKKVFNIEELTKYVVISTFIAGYSYDCNKTDIDSHTKLLEQISCVGSFSPSEKKIMKKAFDLAISIGKGIDYARDLGNTPPTIMTPTYLAECARELSKEYPSIKTKILSKSQMEKLNMGGVLGVARGSVEEPKFIIVEYTGTDESKKPTVLVGKGITFDSGGLSLKPGEHMVNMKFDMLGAATVLGSLKSAAELKLKKNLVGLIPSAENMPSGAAFRPDDIITIMNGKTVEIRNTDAEGRLVLADALCYAAKFDPKEVIDFATLTGACMVALGLERSGIFGPDDAFVNKLLDASQIAGEQLWRLPLGEEYDEAIESPLADVNNHAGVGGERYGGASTAAAFLHYFTLDHASKNKKPLYPWVHIDLASAIFSHKGKSWIRVGANGFGVQLLLEYLK